MNNARNSLHYHSVSHDMSFYLLSPRDGFAAGLDLHVNNQNIALPSIEADTSSSRHELLRADYRPILVHLYANLSDLPQPESHDTEYQNINTKAQPESSSIAIHQRFQGTLPFPFFGHGHT
jgi:hypothetical protein